MTLVVDPSAVRSSAPLPLARIAAAMKAGDDVGGSVYDPKEQAIGKAPAPGAAHISENDRELLRRGSNSLDNRFDLGSKASGQPGPRAAYQSRASNISACAAGVNMTGGTVSVSVVAEARF